MNTKRLQLLKEAAYIIKQAEMNKQAGPWSSAMKGAKNIGNAVKGMGESLRKGWDWLSGAKKAREASEAAAKAEEEAAVQRVSEEFAVNRALSHKWSQIPKSELSKRSLKRMNPDYTHYRMLMELNSGLDPEFVIGLEAPKNRVLPANINSNPYYFARMMGKPVPKKFFPTHPALTFRDRVDIEGPLRYQYGDTLGGITGTLTPYYNLFKYINKPGTINKVNFPQQPQPQRPYITLQDMMNGKVPQPVKPAGDPANGSVDYDESLKYLRDRQLWDIMNGKVPQPVKPAGDPANGSVDYDEALKYLRDRKLWDDANSTK